jgi:hypothetical protein
LINNSAARDDAVIFDFAHPPPFSKPLFFPRHSDFAQQICNSSPSKIARPPLTIQKCFRARPTLSFVSQVCLCDEILGGAEFGSLNVAKSARATWAICFFVSRAVAMDAPK